MSVSGYKVEAHGHDRSGRWIWCTPEDAEKLKAMDFENLAVKEVTVVG